MLGCGGIPRRAGAAPALIAMKHKKPLPVKGRRPKGTLDRYGRFVFFTKIQKNSVSPLDHQPARATGAAGAHGTPARRRAAGRQCPGTGRERPRPDDAQRSGESPADGAIQGAGRPSGGPGPTPRPPARGGTPGQAHRGAALAPGPGREARTPARGRRRRATNGSRPCPPRIKTLPHSRQGRDPAGRREGGSSRGEGASPQARAQKLANCRAKAAQAATRAATSSRAQEACRAPAERISRRIGQAARRRTDGADRARRQLRRDDATGRRRRAFFLPVFPSPGLCERIQRHARALLP